MCKAIVFLSASLFFGTALAAAPADVTVEMLQAGIEARLSTYRNMEFEYTATETIQRAPDASADVHDAFGGPVVEGLQKSTNTFKILGAQDGKSRPWRSWKRYAQSSRGDRVLERYAVFDGAQSRRFLFGNGAVEGKWNSGLISAEELTVCFARNPFQSFLCLGLTGPDPESIFGIGRVLTADEFAIAGETDANGLTIWKLSRILPEVDVKYELEVSDAPEFIVRRYDVEYQGRQLAAYETTQVKTVDGVFYPAAGRLWRLPHGYAEGHKYEFEVVSATRLTETDRDGWLPEWPAGTIVVDTIRNENITIAREVKEYSEDVLHIKRESLGNPPNQYSFSWRSILLLSANVVAIVVLLALYFRRYRMRRA